MLHYFNEYYELIEDSPLLQMDGEICLALRKTPAEVYQLEKQGLLDYEAKVFLWAFCRWRMNFQLENHTSLF